MTRFLKHIILFVAFAFVQQAWAQFDSAESEETMPFEAYLAYVKKHHPLMKQANIVLTSGEANLLKARGGFDPKIEVDYDRKKFETKEYYDQLNATFKIPTWYGIEFKANYENNTGEFLSRSATVPEDGLYSAGVSFSLAQGLLMNERMATLKKARFFQKQTQADRDLLVNSVLYDASKAYFEWLEATNEQNIYQGFLDNATTRMKAVERSVAVGDKASIDITEIRITVQTRQLELEAAKLKRMKAALAVSNYLWINDIPMELQDEVRPVFPERAILERALLLNEDADQDQLLINHPKLMSLNAKIKGLEVDRALKRNKLLPKVDLQYNFLSTEYDQASSFNTANYKAFVNVGFPIFLRKERGAVRLANLKLKDANLERGFVKVSIENKIRAVNAELNSLQAQNDLIDDIVKDYETMVEAEERKFFVGESSLFLINSRERKLIDAQLKENALMVKQLKAVVKLQSTLGVLGDDN